MGALAALVKRHPVATYFALTFTISWAGVLAVLGAGGVPEEPERYARLLPFDRRARGAGRTRFATPRLRKRHSILATGLMIGVLWGAWHIIGTVGMASGTYAGDLALPIFVAGRTAGLLVGGLPAFRVLMVWVYDRTGSLPVAMLMHASLTAATLTLEPLTIAGSHLLLLDLVSTLVWWTVVALVAVATGGLFSRRPIRLVA